MNDDVVNAEQNLSYFEGMQFEKSSTAIRGEMEPLDARREQRPKAHCK